MSYLRGFIPWIVFAAIGSGHWQWGAPAALVLAAWFLLGDRRRGVGTDALVLECSTVAFFAALSALALAIPDSGVREYAGALAVGWLALTAWTSLAVRRPFTTGIAKRQAPREVWDCDNEGLVRGSGLTRLRRDHCTQRYQQRRIAEGKTKREIIRCLKRYVAREIFRLIT